MKKTYLNPTTEWISSKWQTVVCASDNSGHTDPPGFGGSPERRMPL